jgi:hypothetical protein
MLSGGSSNQTELYTRTPPCWGGGDVHKITINSTYLYTKEVNKEQPSYRNLSATATRVLQCTCPVAASWKYFSAIHPTPHLTSTHLTPVYVNTMILHFVSVLYTAVNVWNKKFMALMSYELFSLFGISLDH